MTVGSSTAVGLLASLAAALLLSVGMVLQALESRKVDERHGLRAALLVRLVRRPRWLAGTLIGYAAFPFQVAALASAPLVLVQPVHACGLLLVLAVGSRLLGEPVGPLERIGVAGIVLGTAMVAWGAPSGHDPADSQVALGSASLALAALSVGPLLVRDSCGRLTLMICAGLGFAAANLAVKGFTGQFTHDQWALAIGYLGLAAIASTLAMLSQMTAFQRHRAVEVVPITFVVPIFLPVALSSLVLHERWAVAPGDGAPFALGAALLLLGTMAVARAGPVVAIARRAAL